MTEPPKKKRPPFSTVWREAKEMMWARRGRLGIGLILIGFNRAAGLALPASTKYVIDHVLHENRPDLLPRVALAVGAATIIQAISSFLVSQLLGVAAQRSITELRIKVHERLIRLPSRFFDERKTGELISRVMNDAEGIRNLVGTGLVQLIGGAITAVIAGGVLLWLNWRLTLIMIAVLGCYGVGMAWAFKILRPLFRERGKINADVTARLTEAVGGVRVVKAYTAEKREDLVFARGAHRLFRNVAKSMTTFSATMAISTLTFGVIGVVMIYFGGQHILAGRMTLGGFLMFTVFTGFVIAPLIQMASIGTQITEAIAGLDRLREIMKLKTEEETDRERERLDAVKGDIEFEGVWFEYNEGQPVLKGVSLRAPAGSTTALVGSSGSGKSTLISLVMAFNTPQRGRVTVDGRDLAKLRMADYRSALGVVMQDNFLFDGTIAENIAYARPRASRADVVDAARIAHCAEFIEGFPDKYETIIGERGVRLSGGQRQRVAIARAILADPRILILDEATSSLDSESEEMIQDGLRALRKGRTAFVIAHRLSTIRSATQILVLEGGEIVERGTHAELMALGGRYRQLHDKQYSWESDRFVNPGEDFTPKAEKEDDGGEPAPRPTRLAF